MVENALGEDDFSRVGAGDGDIGHDGDADVFFDAEGAGVERPGVAEGFELSGGEDARETAAQGKRDKLGNDASNEDSGIWRFLLDGNCKLRLGKPTAKSEDLVKARDEHSAEDSEEPHPEGVDGHQRVVNTGDSSSHFGIRRLAGKDVRTCKLRLETSTTHSSKSIAVEFLDSAREVEYRSESYWDSASTSEPA